MEFFCLNVGLEMSTWEARWFQVLSPTTIYMCICNREPKGRKTERHFSADSWELELITLELGC